MGPVGFPKGPLGSLGALLVRLAALGRLLGRSWRLLGPTWGRLGASWAALGTSWGSFWPPGELFLELFGSLFFNALGKKTKTSIVADSSSLFKVF